MSTRDEKWLKEYSTRTGLKPVEHPRRSEMATPILPSPSPKLVRTLNPWALQVIRDAKLPEPQTEYEFAAPERRFAFDFAWVDHRVALEAEGHVHRTKKRFQSDLIKYNLALARGWRVFRATSKTLHNPEVLIEQLRTALCI